MNDAMKKWHEEGLEKFLAERVEDVHAIRFIHHVFRLFSVVDHINDEEGEENRKSELIEILHLALIEIPTNPFYIRFQPHFTPLLLAGIEQWRGSNLIEGTAWAYVLRRGIVEIIPMIIYLLHGRAKMEKATDIMRENEMGIETFAEYRESCYGMVEQSEAA